MNPRFLEPCRLRPFRELGKVGFPFFQERVSPFLCFFTHIVKKGGVSCHFLQAEADGTVKPVAGVSCESCHGAARDWIKVHNDYGGKGVKKEQETAEHRRERLEKSRAAGMIRPAEIYRLAANCYQVWNETFDRRLTSVFAIQSEIAESVVSRLAETLLESYVGSAPYEPDIDAYQAFLVGREYLHNRSPGYQESALENFNEAMRLLPQDGPSGIYIRRCKEYIKKPPPQSWDGVFNLPMK